MTCRTAARHNAARIPGAGYTKCFNTLTAGFQAAAAARTGDDRVAQWIAGDDTAAKDTVAELVHACGYVPIDLAGIDGCGVMEAPRRPGAVYGEEYRQPDTEALPGMLAVLSRPCRPLSRPCRPAPGRRIPFTPPGQAA